MKKQGKSRRPKPKKKRPATPGAAPARARAVPGTVAVKAKSRPSPKTTGQSPQAARRVLAMPGRVRSVTGVASLDDRIALALLLAPFLIVALSLGAERTARQIIARTPQLIAAAQPPATRALPPPPATPARPERVALLDPTPPAAKDIAAPQTLPALAPMIEPPLPRLALIVEPPAPPLPPLALVVEPPLPRLALIVEPPAPPLPPLALVVEPPLPQLALIVEPPSPSLPALALIEGRAPALPVCLPIPAPTLSVAASPPQEPAAFGLALAAAASAQTQDFVIYNSKYQRISYPMGDVPSLFGVCTDVIIRAYRTLGIDLQALVQEMKLGTGDRNIDHRRVEVVRRLLTRHGTTLPISDLAEDYQPGDIVTYYRPQNRSSTSHIAIVSDRLAPSGRPMIVHNRGWGPELEDALFVDKITGHYRFSGVATAAKGDSTPAQRRVATK